jgi:hypothetical protein
MRLLAPGATAWSGKAFSLFKNITAGHAAEREHHELSFLCHCRQGNVRQMFIDFFFSNANGLRYFPRTHLPLAQKEEYFLAHGLGVALVAHDHPVCILSQFFLTGNICNIKDLILHP